MLRGRRCPVSSAGQERGCLSRFAAHPRRGPRGETPARAQRSFYEPASVTRRHGRGGCSSWTAGVRIPCQALARERTRPLVVPRKAASRPCCSKGPAPRGREEAPASCFFIFCRGKLTEASAAGPTGEPGSFRPGTGQASTDTLSALASDSRVQGVGVCWSSDPFSFETPASPACGERL